MEISTVQALMPFLVIASVLAVACVLIYGFVQMAKPNSASPADAIAKARRSNKLMQIRIILQAVAIALFLLMLFLRG